MTTKDKVIGGIAVLAVVLALVGLVGGNQSVSLSDETISEIVAAVNRNLGASGTRLPNGVSADTTSPVEGEVRGTTLVITATTTLGRSYDGFTAGGDAPATIATGTVYTLYTHVGGPAVCDASEAALLFDSSGFSPGLVASIGTSTTAVSSTNLLASTTIATTTDTLVAPNQSLWILQPGQVITAIFGDNISNASSTYFSNWGSPEFQVQCWLIGG